MAHEITKEFWKNSHFENMRADFPLQCQNSLRWNTPEIVHFQAWKKNILNNIVSKWLFFSLNAVCIVSRWYFDPFLGQKHIQKPTFVSKTQYFRDKLSLFCTEVSFDTTEENQLSYFQNAYFFKILWWLHEPNNQLNCR